MFSVKNKGDLGYLYILMICMAFHVLKIETALASSLSVDERSAVILAYGRINEDNFPQTNLRLSHFESHIREIISGGYNVAKLPELIDALQKGQSVPPNTIAITFEGAYKSAFENAFPILLENDIPFTIFYASDNAEQNSGEYMSWNDLRSLRRNRNVSFGILPSSYVRVIETSDEEDKRLLNKAKVQFRDNFGDEATLFSYPFGQHNQSYQNMLKDRGIQAAFGLQSGVAYEGMDFFNIPRFTMTEGFGDIQRFRRVTQALPIPAIDVTPKDHVLDNADKPLFGFSVSEEASSILEKLSCFISNHGRAQTVKAGPNRIEIRPKTVLDDERIRINCTANTGTSEEPQWRWFGMLYTMPSKIEEAVIRNNRQDALPQLPE